jgi:hypothetical protein
MTEQNEFSPRDCQIEWATGDRIDTSAYNLVNKFTGRNFDPDELFISDESALYDFITIVPDWEAKETEGEELEAIRKRLEGLYGFSFGDYTGEFYIHDVARFIDRKQLELLKGLEALKAIDP